MSTPLAPAPSSRIRALAAIAAFALGVLPFLGSLSGEFLNWDDRMALLENEAWRGFSLEHLGWMATSFHMGHHMPLTWFSWAADHALWGLDPLGFHLTSVLLHGLNAVLVLALADALLRRCSALAPRARLAAALGAALLFAVHPLRAESVAWITERRDVLSCLFLLGTLLAWLRSSEPGARRAAWLALALVLYLLSLLSKAWGITLPALLLVLDLLVLRRRAPPRREPWSRLLGELALFAPFALASAILAAAAQRHGQAMLDLEQLGPLQRLAQAAYGLCAYPLASLWPVNLGPLYALDPSGELGGAQIAALAVVILALPALFVLARRRPSVAGALISYAVLVSPVLGLAQSGVQAWADRYSYLACIPLAILLAAALAHLAQRAPRRAPAIAGVSLALLVLLGQRTWAQTRVWQDSISVWSRVVAVEPASFIGHWMLGVSLQEAARHDEAVAHFERALAQRPDGDARLDRNNPGVRYRMALSLFELGRPAEAEAALRAVLAQRPDHPPALERMRVLLLARGDGPELEQLCALALQADPQSRLAWLILIDSMLGSNRSEDALVVARQANTTLPDDAALLARQGYAQLLLARLPQAEQNLRRAIELDPELITARVHLGDVLAAAGDPEAARTVWIEARARAPEHPGLAQRLGP